MKTFAIVLLGACAAAKTMSQLDYDYMRYVVKYGKKYDTVEEFGMRQARFAETDEFVRSANQKGGSYTAGHNQFSDWT